MSSFYPLPHLPSTRRFVTGHSADGKAIFTHDDYITAVNPRADISPENEHSVPGLYLVHRTTKYPVDPQGPEYELSNENLARSKNARGDIICEIVDVPPLSISSDVNVEENPVIMHRNQSLDYGVILKGSITLILDDGVEKTLSEGDVFVQRGTMHGWKNTGSDHCRFMTVIIPSAPVKTSESGSVLQATKFPGLTD
ncbi:hypothetical protein BGW36DRAFT_426779 [Talaromyces proteolyticus]|uniref:Cupin type-2 domain-containing protein n=1 Tax=Talaromyces proteolyticus TaxID=1131652 RepID=A0AAD4PZJ8_9EURO|nr:uncharacterized protein BGW36DRAFT_426779 [Talaromyces proteolyticus]KAH8699101.1 hypothetical protein BGW36DRAFT_426779 [Talaromyces proteolyticus]